MDRRRLLLSLAALPLLPAAAAAQSVDAAPIDAYLRQLRRAEGRFRQVNANGSSQTGRFFLLKPGRIRFEYDAPPGAMVIADGGTVGVFDPKSNRGPQRYPLSGTPLALLLRDDIGLAEPGMVRGATRDAAGTHITVVDPRAPDEGRLVMSFTDDPIALTGWVVTTKAGQRTEVAVTEMRTGVEVASGLFNIEAIARGMRN